MDKKDVYLKIVINYEGQKFEKTFIDFQTLEEIKDISKNEFKINDDIFNKLQIKCIIEPGKESKIITNDDDLIILMKPIDDYNYEINLELSLDEFNILKNQGELRKKFDNYYFDKKRKEITEIIKLLLLYSSQFSNSKNLEIKFLKIKSDYESKKNELEKIINNYQKNYEPKQFKEILNNIKLKDEKSVKLAEEKNKLSGNLKKFEKIQEEIENELQKNFSSFKEEIIKMIMEKFNIKDKEYKDKYADVNEEEKKYKPNKNQNLKI